MRTLFLLFSTLLLSQVSFSQEFKFSIFFKDAIGNKDTIVLGYDPLGTDSIDQIFGEENIISKPLNPYLDVRISDEWFHRKFQQEEGTFHTKKQIVKSNCGSYFSVTDIDIYCTHWPVTATWDSNLFSTTCLNGSVFTSCNPGGWWDVGCPSNLGRAVLFWKDSVTYNSNALSANDNYYYLNNQGDTIPVYWQAFGDSTLLSSGIEDYQNLYRVKIYPNPTNGCFTIRANFTYDKIELFNGSGQAQHIMPNENTIDISSLNDGFYFLRFYLRNLFIRNEKVLKINTH
jgi:hypothetical protein